MHKSLYTTAGVISVWMYFICLAYITLYIQSPITDLLLEINLFSRAFSVYSIAYLTDFLSVLIYLLVIIYTVSLFCKISIKNFGVYFVLGFLIGYTMWSYRLEISISTVIQFITAILVGTYFYWLSRKYT